MFPSTISITIATGVTKVLNRVNQDSFNSEYLLRDATSQSILKIRHSLESKDSLGNQMARHNVYFEYTEFPTLTTPVVVRSYTMTMRAPAYSDPTVLSDLSKGVGTWLATSTNYADIASGIN